MLKKYKLKVINNLHYTWHKTHHAVHDLSSSIDGGAFRCVTIAKTVSSHHHVVNRIVVLLLDLYTWVQKIVPESMQPSELHPQISDL